MTRGVYLKPSKFFLLNLIAVYSEGLVPTSNSTAILSFIISQVLPDHEHHSAILEQHVPVSHYEASLSKHASAIPGRTVFDLLLKRVWMIDCLNALDDFIMSLPFLLSKSREQILRERETGEGNDSQPGKILRTSPLGAFIRRCHLEYSRLQFNATIVLWQDLIRYRAPTMQTYEKRNPADDRNLLDVNLSEFQVDALHPLSILTYGRLNDDTEQKQAEFSLYDSEKLMEFQVSEMQRLGGRLPDEMKGKLMEMSATGVTVPKLVYYLNFLDSWRAGDYSSAFENLHRYFDYTMHTRDRTFYQYALLNLAILQADFGCHSEAIPAMQEAIATARENKDTACLNFCMSWLYHFGRSFPTEMKRINESGILGNETEGLAFLKSRAKDAEMWNLLGSSLLSEAKIGLQYGESLSLVFENIFKASHINTMKSVQDFSGPTILMKASAFSRVGLTHLGWLCGETFLDCHAGDAPIEDVLKCICRLAGILSRRGRNNESVQLMNSMPCHIFRVLKHQNYWNFYMDLLKLQEFIHRDDLSSAEYMSKRIAGQSPPDIEIGFALSMLQVEILLRRGNFTEALKQVENLAERILAGSNDVIVQCKLLNFKARLLSRTGYPLKGFSIVTRAAQIALRARVLPALWESVGILANILNELQEFTAAGDLLRSIVPQVLECDDCELAARSYSYLADADMGLASLEDEKSTRRKELVSIAMEHVDDALANYAHIEDLRGQLEMLSKKAQILHWRGDLILANDASSQYLELKKQYEARKL